MNRSGSSGSKPVSGLVSAQISLRGTADDPRLKVAFKGRRLQVKQLPPSDIDVVAESADEGRLKARADLNMDGKKRLHRAQDAVHAWPDTSQAARPRGTHGSRVRARGGRPRGSPEASVRGGYEWPPPGWRPERAGARGRHGHVPRGEVSVSGHGLATQGVKPLDVLIRVQLGDELHADVRAERGREPIFTAKARVGPVRDSYRTRTAWPRRRSHSRRTSAHCPCPSFRPQRSRWM